MHQEAEGPIGGDDLPLGAIAAASPVKQAEHTHVRPPYSEACVDALASCPSHSIGRMLCLVAEPARH